MRRTKQPPQATLSLRVPEDLRRWIERTAARLTLERGDRYTLTDVVVYALSVLDADLGPEAESNPKPRRKRGTQ